tara:strand:- start:81 stop:473 length:393 start_codon:yes stop_codon:yes gene_type:complete
MSYAHIVPVATDAHLPRATRFVWIYDVQGQEKCYTGFTSTQELITWMNNYDSEVDCVCMSGEWEVDDDGTTYDDFDAWELYAGDTWEGFKRDFRESQEENERDNAAWREEIAREEGMLGGINSYNDWMGY